MCLHNRTETWLEVGTLIDLINFVSCILVQHTDYRYLTKEVSGWMSKWVGSNS